MKRITCCLCALVACGLVGSTGWAMPADPVPFKIIGKSGTAIPEKSVLNRPQTDYTLSLRNESDKTITAWKLSCLYAENDGNFSVASVEGDAFLSYERAISDAQDPWRPVAPGEMRKVVFSREETGASPYDAMSCQVDAVVFADRSHSGVGSVIAEIFDSRARMAADALRALDVLNGMIDGRPTSEDEALPDASRYSELLHKADLWARAGDSARLGRLRAELQEQVELIEKHLPRQWRLEDADRGPRREANP